MLLVNSDFRSLNLLNRLAKLVYTLFIFIMGTLNNSIDLWCGCSTDVQLAWFIVFMLVTGMDVCVCVCQSSVW